MVTYSIFFKENRTLPQSAGSTYAKLLQLLKEGQIKEEPTEEADEDTLVICSAEKIYSLAIFLHITYRQEQTNYIYTLLYTYIYIFTHVYMTYI